MKGSFFFVFIGLKNTKLVWSNNEKKSSSSNILLVEYYLNLYLSYIIVDKKTQVCRTVEPPLGLDPNGYELEQIVSKYIWEPE